MIVKVKGGFLAVTSCYAVKDRLKALGFKWYHKSGEWRIKISWDNLILFASEFKNEASLKASKNVIELMKEAENKEKSWRDMVNKLQQIRESWNTDSPIIDYDTSCVPTGITLFSHQEKALTAWKHCPALGLFLDCGLGKTLTTLIHLRYLKKIGEVGKALIVCPKSLCYGTWLKEIKKFTPELKAVILDAGTDDNRLILKQAYAEAHPRKKNAAAYDVNADIYIANYEAIPALVTDLQTCGIDFIGLDESSKIKNYKTAVAKALIKLGDTVTHKMVSSGTPAPNSELEYFPQLRFLSSRIFGNNFYSFRSKFFNPTGFMGYQWVADQDPQIRNKFITKVYSQAIRFKEEDVLDLPDQVFQVIDIKLDSKSSEMYELAKKEAVLKIENEEYPVDNPLSVLMKCRQISSGFVRIPKEGSEEVEDKTVHELKLEAVKELLAQFDNSSQVLIWANFKWSIRKLKEMLGDDAATLYSETKDRSKSIDDFETGKVKYLIANPKSAAHGLTFVNCRINIFFEMDFSSEGFHQAKKRTHRIGQTKHVMYYFLSTKTEDDGPTSDEVCRLSCEGKLEDAKAVLDAFTS